MAGLAICQLSTLCGICRSKDFCFREDRLLEDNKDNELPEDFNINGTENSIQMHAGIGGDSMHIELPERAKRYQIR